MPTSSDRCPEGRNALVRFTSPGGGVLEPFDALPMRSSKQMQKLLNHCTLFQLPCLVLRGSGIVLQVTR